MTNLSEQTILKRIAKGDQTAVEDCFNQYGNLIWALAKKYTPTREDAEDAVQEIFTEIWQNAARYDDAKAREITFITTIARRRLIDRVRKVYRRPQTSSIETTFVSNSYEPSAFQQVQAKEIIKAMQVLRPEQRELMLLNIYEGMSHGEISEATGVPLGTVKTHIRRGFERVRNVMNLGGMNAATV
ncbi:MAG TPA: sigma-70 family RNA polymerase sigma factor [Pyrinomonadaceae bacterium]|nr:sigma-70 family RNA polymerase sigma factor [Pyrinomonadaceae bacterium]